ncbi:reverse transcriptase domain-containing protein [Tanacetum coccineum]
MKHQLKAYPLAEQVVYKKRPLTPDKRQALKEKVFNWLKEGIIRKVQHLEWITNATLIKLANGASQVQMDYSSLNRICAKDMYPFMEIEEKLASLIGYPHKCFLWLLKESSQVRMVEDDEEKTRFHTVEGVYYFTHMPKGLKNYAATLQRMMEKVLADQKGRNREVYLEEIVVKSKKEQSLIEDVEETMNKLKWVNMKIDPSKSTFRMNEGRFLGYTVIEEGIRPDPTKVQSVMKSHTTKGPDQIRRLSLQLASIGGFIPKLVELIDNAPNIHKISLKNT